MVLFKNHKDLANDVDTVAEWTSAKELDHMELCTILDAVVRDQCPACASPKPVPPSR